MAKSIPPARPFVGREGVHATASWFVEYVDPIRRWVCRQYFPTEADANAFREALIRAAAAATN